MRIISVLPVEILPSQDFLKEKTIRFIFGCLHNGQLDDLPPTPLVRKDDDGSLVAIDGHNLIAVQYFRNEPIEVAIVDSPHDGLPETSEANIMRNAELAAKYDTVLEEHRKVAAAGIATFADLIATNQSVFAEMTSSNE